MGRLENLIQYLFTRQRWLMHVCFWVWVLLVYVIFFGRQHSNYLQTFFFVSLLLPVTISTTYFFNYFLVPRYFMRGRYGLFVLYCAYTVLGSLFLEMVVASITFVVIARLQLSHMSPASVDIFFLLTSLLMVVFFGVALKLLLQWRQSKEDYQRLMKEKLEAELKFLKTQLNPHFLFNTLNNLYYLTSEKSDKAPEAILALSGILDYILQEGKAVFVPLEKELTQVENYIALELLRYGDRIQVETCVSGVTDNKYIGPMLLITLLENSFKHGVMQAAGKSWIQLRIEGQQEHISISIGNSCNNAAFGKGIGLENLQSQLQHLYRNTFSFTFGNNTPNEFWVHLVLPAKPEKRKQPYFTFQ